MVDITQFIPVGRKNAITRQELVKAIGYTDREVRELISLARQDTVILNMQDGRGYFRPSEDEKHLVEIWKRQEESRLKLHACSLRAARKFLKGLS